MKIHPLLNANVRNVKSLSSPAAGKLFQIRAEFVVFVFLFIFIIDAIKTVRFEMKGIYMCILIKRHPKLPFMKISHQKT